MLVHGASHVVGATNTQQFQRIESDGAVGDSTGFVKVQAIHTSESLHGFQLLHQRVLTCQTNGCEREIQRGEQHQAFRDHTDHTGHCGNDRGTPFAVEMATFQPPTVRTCDQMSSTQSGTTRKVMNFRIVLMPLFRSDTVFL